MEIEGIIFLKNYFLKYCKLMCTAQLEITFSERFKKFLLKIF